jgi:hypothetical protein
LVLNPNINPPLITTAYVHRSLHVGNRHVYLTVQKVHSIAEHLASAEKVKAITSEANPFPPSLKPNHFQAL